MQTAQICPAARGRAVLKNVQKKSELICTLLTRGKGRGGDGSYGTLTTTEPKKMRFRKNYINSSGLQVFEIFQWDKSLHPHRFRRGNLHITDERTHKPVIGQSCVYFSMKLLGLKSWKNQTFFGVTCEKLQKPETIQHLFPNLFYRNGLKNGWKKFTGKVWWCACKNTHAISFVMVLFF